MAVLSIVIVAHCFSYAWGLFLFPKNSLNHFTFIYVYTSSTPRNWGLDYFFLFVSLFCEVIFCFVFYFVLNTFFLFALNWVSTFAVVSRSNRVQKAIKSTIQHVEIGRACLCHPPSYYCAIQVLLKPLPVGMLRTMEELLGAGCR